MMKSLNIRINSTWDDEEDLWECKLTVPENVTTDIEETIIKEHNFLCDEENIYGNNGRNPVTLMDYICNKYGWDWNYLEYDIDLNLA